MNCLSSLLGNFVSTKYNLSSAYMPSFQKKEVGSVGQRIQLAPLAGQHASKMFFHLCKADKIIPDTFRYFPPYSTINAIHDCFYSTSAFLYSVSHMQYFHSNCHWDYVSPLFFILSVNLSSPDNKKDKPKSAKAKSISNSSLSETNEGIDISNSCH